MTTEELLQQIADRELLTAGQLAKVRVQVEKSAKPVSAKALANHLVVKGFLTATQAKSLLVAGASARAPQPAEADDELGLAPLADVEERAAAPPPPARKPAPPAKPAASARPAPPKRPPEEPQLMPLDELTELEPLAAPVEKPAARPAAKSRPPAPPKKAEDPASLLDELVELEPAGPPAAGGSPLDLLSASAAAGADGGALLTKPAKKGFGRFFGSEPKRRKKGENEWDSPLMLVGGGALLALVLLGVGVYFLYTRGNGDQQFKLAEDDYRSGAYTQAVSKYTDYLQKFPTHPSASMARVHRGLAQLRAATENTSDYSQSLDVAQTIIREIENEQEFTEARAEFRSLLPDIAEGLAREASKQKNPDAVKQKLADAEKALSLVLNTNYVPKSQQPLQRITAIREIMAVVTRDQQRDSDLASTVAGMKASVEQGKIAEAYAARKQLLKAYPDLLKHETLAGAVLAVAEGEKNAVQFSEDQTPATTEPASTAVKGELALAARRQGSAETSAAPVAMLVKGSVYGVDSGSGKVLWRQYVGLECPAAPLPVEARDGADLLVIDANRNDLLRLAAAEGKIVWRQPLAERIAGVVLAGKQAVATTFSGKLVAVDLNSGGVVRTAILPQPARGAAAVEAASGRIYQMGEQSTVYTFSPELECLQAYYFGHESGTIAVPPLALSRHLIVAENRGATSCTLSVIALAEGGTAEKIVQKVELSGQVLTPLQMAERKLAAITTAGHIRIMGVNPSDSENPLAELADQPPTSSDVHLMRHLLLEQGNLWIADKRLMRYQIQSAAGRLTPAPLEDDYVDCAYEQPLLRMGDLLIHARSPADAAGALISGTRLSDGKRLWEVQVATPLAGEPSAGASAAAVTSSGQFFALPDSLSGSQVINAAANAELAAAPPLVLSRCVELPDGRAIYSPKEEDNRMLLVADGKARLLEAPQPLACAPAGLGKGVLVPTSMGQVFWLNPATGKPVSEPFQPSVSAGNPVAWTTPDADGPTSYVISDGLRLYRVALERLPVPHLAATATSQEIARPVVTPVAITGTRAVAADDAGQLHIFQLPELTPVSTQDMDAPVVWGPQRVGPHVLLATANEELICLDAEGNTTWRQALAHGPLSGPVSLIDGALALASLDGHLVRLNPANGQTLGATSTGQPLATGPVAHNKHWLVGTVDGALLAVEPPAAAPQTAGGSE